MQVKINGEQPFQVLGTNFTIGPSRMGYDLMFSADGFSYSKLFTVGADINRQVTQVAAGSYYYLAGNTDEVTINWMKDCGGNNSGGGGGSYVLPIASDNVLGGVKIGSGITIDANGAISAQGGSGGGKTPIIIEEHYNWEGQEIWEEWLPIYNNLAELAVEMGIEEFSKNYDVYLRKDHNTETGTGYDYLAIGFGLQDGEDEGVMTKWLTFWTLQGDGSFNYWLVSTGTRGIGAIMGFNTGSLPEAKSAYIALADSAGTVYNFNIDNIDNGIAQYNDHNMERYAFSMYLIYTPGDAERYRGNLVCFEKSYNGNNGDFYFQFIISINGVKYNAEYYLDSANYQMVKLNFEPYKTYLQRLLNS